MKKRMCCVLAVIVLLALSNPVWGKETIKAAGGQIGGGWYTIVSGLAEIVNDELKGDVELVVVPGAGVSNIATCSMGNTPIVMSFPPFIVAAQKGVAPYQQKYTQTRVIASGFGTSAQHLVTTRDDLNSYGDIAAEQIPIRIALNKPGATDEFIWKKVMQYYDMSYEDIKAWGGKVFHVGHGESISLMKDRHADTHYSYISVPAASITELSVSRNLKYIGIPGDLHQHLIDEWSLLDYTIPAGTYKGQGEDLQSLGMSNTLMASADLDQDVIYAITKTICENFKDVRMIHKGSSNWKPEMGPQGVESLLHAGAQKYYQEMGYLE